MTPKKAQAIWDKSILSHINSGCLTWIETKDNSEPDIKDKTIIRPKELEGTLIDLSVQPLYIYTIKKPPYWIVCSDLNISVRLELFSILGRDPSLKELVNINCCYNKLLAIIVAEMALTTFLEDVLDINKHLTYGLTKRKLNNLLKVLQRMYPMKQEVNEEEATIN